MTEVIIITAIQGTLRSAQCSIGHTSWEERRRESFRTEKWCPGVTTLRGKPNMRTTDTIAAAYGETFMISAHPPWGRNSGDLKTVAGNPTIGELSARLADSVSRRIGSETAATTVFQFQTLGPQLQRAALLIEVSIPTVRRKMHVPIDTVETSESRSVRTEARLSGRVRLSDPAQLSPLKTGKLRRTSRRGLRMFRENPKQMLPLRGIPTTWP